MDSVGINERALLERVESSRQELREAEERHEENRRYREMQRRLALAMTLQYTENRHQRLRNDAWIEGARMDSDDENTDERTCVTCLDDLSDHNAHRSHCGHHWCRTCIVNRYDMASKSTYLFPAQCCNEPILPDNHDLVAPAIWARYFEKKTQVETPNPTFCSKRDCSKFIPRRDINRGRARCVCGQITCTGCKAEWHTGECVVDPETEQVLRLAREERWQTCFHCREMVVRRDGCNEIVCRCGHVFCYACGKQWKTCPCPQFGRAEPDNQPPARPLPDFELVARMHEELHRDLDRREATLRELNDLLEVENTHVRVAEILPRRRRAPRHPRPLEPVRLFRARANSTDASDEETAVNHRASAARRPGHVPPTNTGCDEHSWRRIGGGRTCQSCNTSMPNFLFRCRTCRHTSCLRCRIVVNDIWTERICALSAEMEEVHIRWEQQQGSAPD